MLNRAKAENIQNWIEKINTYNSTPEFGTTRVLFTEPEIAAREYVKDEMRKLGLAVREDSIGNIFGTLVGNNPELAPVWTGSHIDTVLNAGMFDGMAGVVGGMEALRLIKESGVNFDRSIEVIVYTSEEPTRFGLCCLGSRAMAGHLTLEDTKKLEDKDGKTLESVLKELGYNLNKFEDIPVKKGEVFAAVELHVEQNNKLEKKGLPVGIVKTICAPTNFTVEVTGCQSHAGGTSMEDRRDAYAASCEIALILEDLALKCSSEYNTATVGRVEVIPNAVNVIPGKVRFSIDIRDCEFETKVELIEELKKEIRKIEDKRGVQVKLINENNDIPMKCDATILNILRNSCEDKGIPYDVMISGAYHDSMFVGEFTPVAMVFVPSKNGISHSPEEWTDFKDIALGVDVLAKSLLELANKKEL
ncbi:Zn-dependent hydrolase [Clostridium polyendosporum]|uniref:Zn-dependent hydrolase n=1 Tax=Clostridium polyendosporum TaxID=69208 RepID=A0A919S1R9_9CLOT|nr:M20 family metallo-hydrolase [Clostridium polyendosporum]GIM30351.1 Zn-dependent hydrolase [Clostridium polyendosporum]